MGIDAPGTKEVLEGRVEGKGWWLSPGEKDAAGQPIFHCAVCGHGCRTPAGVRLHQLAVHEGPVVGEGMETTKKKPAKKPAAKKPAPGAGLKECPVCGGEVRLLRAADPRHKLGLALGYTRYCTNPDCEEMFK